MAVKKRVGPQAGNKTWNSPAHSEKRGWGERGGKKRKWMLLWQRHREVAAPNQKKKRFFVGEGGKNTRYRRQTRSKGSTSSLAVGRKSGGYIKGKNSSNGLYESLGGRSAQDGQPPPQMNARILQKKVLGDARTLCVHEKNMAGKTWRVQI